MKSLVALSTYSATSLPPHGGSGLKYDHNPDFGKSEKSPSTRREWIEIMSSGVEGVGDVVSLHTEGVD